MALVFFDYLLGNQGLRYDWSENAKIAVDVIEVNFNTPGWFLPSAKLSVLHPYPGREIFLSKWSPFHDYVYNNFFP